MASTLKAMHLLPLLVLLILVHSSNGAVPIVSLGQTLDMAQTNYLEYRKGFLAALNETSFNLIFRAVEVVTTFRVPVLDDSGSTSLAQANIDSLIDTYNASYILGQSGSDDSIEVGAARATSASIPYFAPFSGNPALSTPYNQYIVNLRPSYTDEIVGLIHHLTYTLEIARVSILYENTARSWTIASFAYTTLASIGLQVESNATFDPITWSDTSLNSAVRSLSSGYPGAIIMIGAHQPLSRFVVLARSVWPSIVYATISKASTEEFVNGITGSKDNIIVSQVVPPPSAVNFPWVQTYQQGIQKSGYPRQYTFASAEGYLAGKLLYSVMFNAYINSQSFMEALQQPNLQIRVGSANVNVGPYTSSCNQGLKNVYITKPSTDSTFALLDTFSYSTCAADTTLLMKPILFGQSAGLTGPLSTVVARYQVGIKAGIAQYNNDIGQVQYFNPPSTTSSAHLRQKISLSFLDDGGDATRTINNTQRLISQGVFGLIGSAGVDNTLASASEAAAAKVPLIGSFSGALGLRFPYNRYGINARASELDEAVAIIDLLVNKLELTKISLYYNERTFKQSGGYQALVDTLVSYEMTLVSETTTTDTQAVTALLKGEPEAVIMYASESELRDFSFYAIDSALKTAKFVVYSAVGSSTWSTQAWAHFTSATFYQSMVFPPLDYGNPVTQAYLTALPAGETADIASLEGYIAAQLVAAMLRGYQSPALAKETFLDVAYPSVLSIGSGGLGLGPYSVACNQGSRQVWIGDASKGNTYVSDIKFTGCGSQLTFNNVSAIIPPPPTSYANAVVGVAVGVAVPVGVIFIILGVYFTKKCHHKAKEYKDEDILFVLPDKINSSFADPARGEFPLELSVTELDFGGSEQPDIETWISDQFTIRNVLVNKPYKFTFYTPPKSEKYTMSVFPRKGKLRPGERMDVRVDIMFHCTTRLTCKLMMEAKGLSAEDSAVHCFLSIDKGSALSTKLDFDEIKMNGPPIGDGSFGTVYRGTWRGQDVAVKMLKVQADLSETQLFDLLREVNIMNKLRNPNIVSFTGAVTTPGKMCLVTEFVPLGNLTKYLKDGILSYAQKLKIASDAANGMNFLHRAGILHRDLKPDNLLVVSLNVNAPIMIKLSDFGSSRSINEEMARNYTAGIGTPIYMAPEILTKEAYSVKADVYSFAILLYELYNEKEPYQDFAHSWDVAKFVTEGGRPPKIEGCPEDYWKIIEKCWAHDPLARPTFEEIFVDFQKLFDELPEESILASLAQTFDTLRKSTYGLTASGSLRNNKVRSMSKSEGFRLVVEKIDEGSGMKTKSVGREEERERRRKHRKRKSRRMKSLNSATAAELMELPPVAPQASEAKIDITSESTFAAPSSRLPVSRVDTKNNFLKHDSSAHIKRQDSTLNNPGHRKFSFGVSNEV